MRKKIKYFLIIIFIFLIGFIFYLYKLHSLAVEGNKIFGLRCKNVNPLLISYKNSFLKHSEYINKLIKEGYLSEKEQDQAMKHFENYLKTIKKYTEAENQWLNTQKKFMERWDFKLFFPWYMKKAAQYQLKMYQGYRDDAQQIIDIYERRIVLKNDSNEENEPRKRRDKYIKEYNNFLIKISQMKDWRKIFLSLPAPKECTPENTIFPSTEGAIDFEGKPSFDNKIPINPDLTS